MRLAPTVTTKSGRGGRFCFKAALASKDTHNVTYKQRLGRTPYSCIYDGELKDISRFRSFGCRAWVFLNAERREKGKHIPRSQEAIYLGFEPNDSTGSFFNESSLQRGRRCGQLTKHSLVSTCSLSVREVSSNSSQGIIWLISFFRLHLISSGLLTITCTVTQAIIQGYIMTR
jgi:hypothetical protein